MTLETRSFEIRADETEPRTVAGIAVPWDVAISVGGIRERFERGAAQAPVDGRVLLYDRHAEPIGKLTAFEDTDDGWSIRAQFSDTVRGRDAWTLARDGVMTQMSVGFIPREDDEDADGTIVRRRVEVREVSLVPFGAYGADAPVTDVRAQAASDPNAAQPAERQSPMTDTITAAEATELRGSIEELSRSVAQLATREDDSPTLDTRTAGEVLKAIVAGDETSIRGYEDTLKRAYTGGTTADTVAKAGWVGDLTRLFDSSSGALANIFGQGTLPESGMSIEYAQLKSNTITVAEQANEGDDIAFGKVQIETKTAPVKTYAGGTQLTRQEVERSSVNVVNTSLEALAVAAAARKKAVLRAAFNAAVAAREAIATNGGVVLLGAALGASTALQWTNVVVDAAVKLEPENLGIDALIVSASVFKRLNALETTGHRVFKVSDTERGIGELNLPGLEGNLAGIRVVADTGLSSDAAAFVNGRAIKQYDSPLVSLQDDNLVNLSKTFAVYRYGAVATEIPAGIVPIKLAAS
ncbi:HK97 family phage prohead protease [Microbacterium sp. cx-55]|uniref:HK97 family phage prohead protease n=1 Tax=Microbacterium sp. cx-55 TaxID=2875948 RepID=UPI001CBF5803|nr:HK97 family phage prohead protease [Microbacterium sp. cx-55]MBZ4485967.1 HK97 family phage prohead protease [Microbacterium sp. cx-55]UGB34159.1 HK97 family phage prohead protease [Microbacterium sp. cx-55]